MRINLDPRSPGSNDTLVGVSVPIATDGRKIAGTGGQTMESVVQAEFGNHKQTMTTGTYVEEVAKQLDIKEVKSDLDMMDPSDFISKCTTGEDAHDLTEEKTPLEEYTASSLERALVRVKAQREDREEAVENEAEKIRENERSIRERSEEIAESIRLITDASMQYLVKNEEKITPHSINDSLYGSGLS